MPGCSTRAGASRGTSGLRMTTTSTARWVGPCVCLLFKQNHYPSFGRRETGALRISVTDAAFFAENAQALFDKGPGSNIYRPRGEAFKVRAVCVCVCRTIQQKSAVERLENDADFPLDRAFEGTRWSCTAALER